MRGAIQMSSAKTSGRDDYCTPTDIIELLTEHWVIDLDPCSNGNSPVAPMRGRLFGGAEDDGLATHWHDLVDGGIAYFRRAFEGVATVVVP